VQVEVADSGSGIPTDLRPHLFEPYVRGDRGRPGLGLGLATVRRLVEAHHGTVGCRPARSGAGAVFWFELPALPPTANEEGAGRVEVA
jgi:signal transduction histidine kinase